MAVILDRTEALRVGVDQGRAIWIVEDTSDTNGLCEITFEPEFENMPDVTPRIWSPTITGATAEVVSVTKAKAVIRCVKMKALVLGLVGQLATPAAGVKISLRVQRLRMW